MFCGTADENVVFGGGIIYKTPKKSFRILKMSGVLGLAPGLRLTQQAKY
jgi:hypothetical protein